MEESVDLSSFPLLRIDQISLHETSVLVDSEAQLSALGRDEDAIEPFVSKLLVHIRKELARRSVVPEERTRVDGWSRHCSFSNDESSADRIGQGRRECPLPSTGSKDMLERSTRTVADSSSPARSHSSPSSRPPNYQNPDDRATKIRSSCQPSFFVSTTPKSKSSSFRSRAKQAQASLRARSNEVTTRRSEQERHERTRRALETMQDWRAKRVLSRKRREELLRMERGLRLERERARMERERQVRSSMHAAAEEAKAKALASGRTDEDAIVEAAAAAAKVADDESTVFQCADADSDDDSFINGEYTYEEESSASKLSSDEMLQVDSSFVIANDDPIKKGGEGCQSVSESCLSPNQSNLPAASYPTPGPHICSECIVEPIQPSTPGNLQLEKSGESTKTDSGSHAPIMETINLDASPPRLPDVPPPPIATLRWTQDVNDDDDRTSTSSESTDDIETNSQHDLCFQAHTQETPPFTPPNETHRSLLTTSGKRTLKEAAKPCRVMAAPDKKYCDIIPSFSGIFVYPAGGHMQTSDADVRQSELSKSLQNQIAQYTKMSTAFASISLEEASDLSDCNGTFDQGLFYHINSRRPEVASIIRRAFSNSSWSELPRDVEGNCWNLMWVWGLPKASTFENLLVFQRINRFRDTRGLTRKDLLKKNMDSSKFTPLTYALPHEWNQFVTGYQSLQKANGNKTDNYWIMKPVGLSRGRGISVVNDIADVSYSRPMVIQRYIQNPLCFMGYKFDLRMYVLVTSFSPLEAFIYKEGLARFGSRQYSLGPESLNDRRIHLTNSSVQKEYTCDEVDRSHPAYLAGSRGYESKVAFTWLWKRLEGLGMDTKELWGKLVDVCRTALLTTGSDIQHQPNSFEIFGYDLMFDRDLKCWLIEVNSSPSLACDSPLDDQVKGGLIRDTIALVDPPAYDRRALTNVCKRRLIHRKSSSNVSNRDVLEKDLAEILMDKVPRKFGEMPRRLGNYERIVPMDSN